MRQMFELTDRENVLTHIIFGLLSTGILSRAVTSFEGNIFGDRLHFANYRKPVAGDLVIGSTGHNGQWKIAFYVEPLPPNMGGAVVRDIATGQLCNYANEDFTPIVGLRESQLYCGLQREIHAKVLQAFGRGDEYMYRFGGLKFEGDEVEITIRPAHGGFGNGEIPFTVRMPFNKRTSVKAILKTMRDGGYGTRKFEKAPLVEQSPAHN